MAKRRVKEKVLIRDLVIPAGTVFKCCDGRSTTYGENNYACDIGVTNDTSGELIYGFDDHDQAEKFFVDLKR